MSADADGAVRLRLTVGCSRPPECYLLAVSARPHSLPEVGVPITSIGPVGAVPVLSQMTAAPGIARRICSPTSLTMALAALATQATAGSGRATPACAEPDADAALDALWQSVVSECLDPGTGLYGVWPLAIGAAARRGHPGAVELFCDWKAPLEALARGIPVVASIRFGPDALPGAPLRETGGHLVVVTGAGPGEVTVHDPAAPVRAEVARRYPADAFAHAWLANRGAAYILCP